MPPFKRLALLVLLALPATLATAQKSAYTVVPVSLPQELADKNNQFSGLFCRGSQLLLLAESRLQEGAEAKVYALDLAGIDQQLAQKTGELSYKKYAIQHLDRIRAKIDSSGQTYEGLEALTMIGDEVYLTVETTTPSPYGYVLKGQLNEAAGAIVLDSRFLVPVAKPVLTNGGHVHNAGFEALAPAGPTGRDLLMLFEYNYFGQDNYAYRLPSAAPGNDILRHVPVARLPFRVTDIVYQAPNRYTAINYFYKGDDDAVYRPAADDANAQLIREGAGYKGYCRLISVAYKKNRLSWQPLFELPAEYMTYNWEGLATYKQGYFLINDKYGPSNQSTLIYLQPKK